MTIPEVCEFPEWDYFLKLADKYSNSSLVKILRGQKSCEGRELVAFAIGHGKKIVGVTSGAHSDEPIGVLTQVYFIDSLLNNPKYGELLSEYTFLCHPLVDPDGYVLNSRWFKNPLNFKDYFLHNYRNNKPSEDCEHGIPFQESQTARQEMTFVKNNIDQFNGQFEYYVTLHSSHVLPGVCFVFDRDHKDTGLRNRIAKICETHLLPMMDYKVKGDETMKYLGPGFIGAPTVQSMLDHYKNQPEILNQIKMTTYEYAQVYGGAKSAFISELPIWLSTGFDNYADSDMTMNDLKKKQVDISKDYFNLLEEIDSEISPFNPSESNPWYSSLKMALKRGKLAIQDEESKLGTYEGLAQELEVKELSVFSIENQMKAYKYAIKSTEEIVEATELRNKYQILFDSSVNEYQKALGLKNISVKTQVEVQIGLIFSGLSEKYQNI